jgi:hypothetical protein
LIILLILPFLFLNGLGSTLYHGFRDVPFFFYLDFLPASCMSILLSTYLWNHILKNVTKSILTVISFYLIGSFAWYIVVQFEGLQEIGPNIGYLFVGLSFITPIIILLKTGIFSLGFALLFRMLDHPSELFSSNLPQGTHFLWHIFTVLAVFFVGYYVYFLAKLKNR